MCAAGRSPSILGGLALLPLAFALTARAGPGAGPEPILYPGSAATTVVLPLRVNGVDSGEAMILFDGTDALVRAADLEAAGIRRFAGLRRTVRGEELVSLSSLAPEVAWRFDEANLRLVVDATAGLLPRGRIDLSPGRPPGIFYTDDPSAFLNYSVTLDDKRNVSAFSEAGWSLGHALLYSSVFRQSDGKLLRGMTNVTVDDRTRMVRWVAGDNIAASGNLGGGAFLAGLTVSRSFDLDPYFYRYPGLGISGAVTSPTRADVYVNGRFVRQEMLQPGTFDFTNVPIQGGLGATRVVLHDAFGGQSVLASPYYLSTSLLAKGLSDFSYSVGFRRENTGIESFEYGGPAFIGQHRLGLTDTFTAGLRAEAADGVISGGGSAAFSFLPGQVEAAVAASGGSGGSGLAGFLRASVSFGRLSIGAYGNLTGDKYSTLSLPTSQDRPTTDAGAFASVDLRRLGGLSIQYALQRWRDSGSARRLSAIYNAHLFGSVSFSLSAARSKTPLGGDNTEVMANLNFALGRTLASNVQWRHDDSGSSVLANLQRAAPLGEGYGYNVQGATGQGTSGSATARAQYRSSFGVYEASYSNLGGTGSGYVTASGGVVAIGGSLFATRPVQQAFALIRTAGVEGIEGLNRNQATGRTNRKGDLLVPDLTPYYGNVLGISDTDLPPDYIVDSVRRVMAPPYRGGSIVTFPVRRLRAFTGSVKVSFRGTEIIPGYGTLTVTADGKEYESDIGSTGNLYLEDVPPGKRAARIRYLGASCDFQLSLPESSEPVAKLGSLVCRTETEAPHGAAPPGAPQPPSTKPAAPSASPKPEAVRPLPMVANTTPPALAVELKPERIAILRVREWAGKKPVYVVQVSSYRAREKADADAARLAARFGTTGRSVEIDLGERGTWYRVVLGEFESSDGVRRFQKEIAHGVPGGAGVAFQMEGPPQVVPSATRSDEAAPLRTRDWAGKKPVYVVHASSFRGRETAAADAARLAASFGTAGRAVEVDLGEKGIWYRVVLGEFESSERARQFKDEIVAKVPGGVGGVYRMEGPPQENP